MIWNIYYIVHVTMILWKCKQYVSITRILDCISNGILLIIAGVVELPKATLCFLFERCQGGSEVCAHFCIVTLGKRNGGYCIPNKNTCCCNDGWGF
jgi:hypothetical protein